MNRCTEDLGTLDGRARISNRSAMRGHGHDFEGLARLERFVAYLLEHLRCRVLSPLESVDTGRMEPLDASLVRSAVEHLRQIQGDWVHTVRRRCSFFTPMEMQVAELLRVGNASKEIAAILDVSPHTISFHRRSIRRKLGLVGKRVNLRTYLRSHWTTMGDEYRR